MAKLFGFSIEGADDNNLPQGAVSPVPQNEADKSDYYVVGFMVSTLILKVYSEMNMI